MRIVRQANAGHAARAEITCNEANRKLESVQEKLQRLEIIEPKLKSEGQSLSALTLRCKTIIDTVAENLFDETPFALFIDIWEDEQTNMIDFEVVPELRRLQLLFDKSTKLKDELERLYHSRAIKVGGTGRAFQSTQIVSNGVINAPRLYSFFVKILPQLAKDFGCVTPIDSHELSSFENYLNELTGRLVYYHDQLKEYESLNTSNASTTESKVDLLENIRDLLQQTPVVSGTRLSNLSAGQISRRLMDISPENTHGNKASHASFREETALNFSICSRMMNETGICSSTVIEPHVCKGAIDVLKHIQNNISFRAKK